MYFQNSVSAGIYGNYTLITNALINLSNQLYNGIIASFGNLIATESKDKPSAISMRSICSTT